ncbi:hypothetical protein VTK56DRAFT_7634 [Thermocarpiscus australiensis]
MLRLAWDRQCEAQDVPANREAMHRRSLCSSRAWSLRHRQLPAVKPNPPALSVAASSPGSRRSPSCSVHLTRASSAFLLLCLVMGRQHSVRLSYKGFVCFFVQS